MLARASAVLADLFDLVLQGSDSTAHASAVNLQARLTRASSADAPTLPREHLASSYQAGEQELVLGELDLDATLMGPGVLGEDVQDEGGAVDDPETELILQVLLSAWR